ncbi:MAG: Rnf-Nqr domain containing protein [Alistipes inops]
MQLLMEAYVPSLYETLGVFIPLIVVNCIIFGRAEAFASKHNVLDSALDGLGIGLGFDPVADGHRCGEGDTRSGSVFGYKFIEGDGMIAFVLAPGAFLVLGYLMVLFNKATARLR